MCSLPGARLLGPQQQYQQQQQQQPHWGGEEELELSGVRSTLRLMMAADEGAGV